MRDIAEQYKRRRDVLVKGLHEAGWMVEMPKASMYVWRNPEPYAAMGSLNLPRSSLTKRRFVSRRGLALATMVIRMFALH
ncbi:aminotransferase class I/II-fold pyridoxal phosphate-dependent enzyme [Escherichia coli]